MAWSVAFYLTCYGRYQPISHYVDRERLVSVFLPDFLSCRHCALKVWNIRRRPFTQCWTRPRNAWRQQVAYTRLHISVYRSTKVDCYHHQAKSEEGP